MCALKVHVCEILERKVLHVHVRARVDAHADSVRVTARARAVVLHGRVDLQRARTRAPELCECLRARRGAEAGVVRKGMRKGMRKAVRAGRAAHRPVHVGHTPGPALPGEPGEDVCEHGCLLGVRGVSVWCESIIRGCLYVREHSCLLGVRGGGVWCENIIE